MLKIEKIKTNRAKDSRPYRVIRDNDDGTRTIVGHYKTLKDAKAGKIWLESHNKP